MSNSILKAKTGQTYIPALRYEWLTHWFDLFQRLTMPEQTIKTRLLKQAKISPNDQVLDLGCGTGTLLIMLKQKFPGAKASGLDGDEKVLKLARKKIAVAGVDIQLAQGLASKLPYPDGSFDRVLSSLFFHHLTAANKVIALKEAWRVLRPGGEIHIVDLGKPHNLYSFLISLVMRRTEHAADNIQGLLPEILRQAGFNGVSEVYQQASVFGTISFYKAIK